MNRADYKAVGTIEATPEQLRGRINVLRQEISSIEDKQRRTAETLQMKRSSLARMLALLPNNAQGRHSVETMICR